MIMKIIQKIWRKDYGFIEREKNKKKKKKENQRKSSINV